MDGHCPELRPDRGGFGGGRQAAELSGEKCPYIPSLSQRGIHTEIHLGTAETNHRFYSYRMKRQGRSWSSEGMECMVWVLTARKNKTLTAALLYHANGKSYKRWIELCTRLRCRQSVKSLKRSGVWRRSVR